MKTTVIVNPCAGSAQKSGEILRTEAARFDWRWLETDGPGAGQRLAQQAAADGAERVLAAGGDGTLSEVVRGLMEIEGRPVFGVLPMGTGNDFARTLGMPLDIAEACRWFGEQESAIAGADVLEVRSAEQRTWSLNCVNGGIANEVRAELDDEIKARWGPLAFVMAGFELAGRPLPGWQVSLQLDHGPTQEFDAVVSVLAANARTVGGGFELAPQASIEDGMFDLVVVAGESLLELLPVAVRAKLGAAEGDEHIQRFRGRHLVLRAPEDFGFSVDGEAFHANELTVQLHPQAMPVVRGPNYSGG